MTTLVTAAGPTYSVNAPPDGAPCAAATRLHIGESAVPVSSARPIGVRAPSSAGWLPGRPPDMLPYSPALAPVRVSGPYRRRALLNKPPPSAAPAPIDVPAAAALTSAALPSGPSESVHSTGWS